MGGLYHTLRPRSAAPFPPTGATLRRVADRLRLYSIRELLSPPKGSAMTEPVQCPECGWTGQEDDLALSDGDNECPVCAGVIAFVE